MEMLGTMPRQEQLLKQQRPSQTPQRSPNSMPDIANQSRSALTGTLDWVGMSDIEVPVRLANEVLFQPAPRPLSRLMTPMPKAFTCPAPFLALQTKLEEEELSVCFDGVDH